MKSLREPIKETILFYVVILQQCQHGQTHEDLMLRKRERKLEINDRVN